MANRVNVNITARDLTRGELARLRRNFAHLSQDLDRVVTNRTRQNWDRLGESLRASRRDLQALRGNIPDDEFFRLDRSMRQAQRTMSRGFGRVGDRAFAQLTQRLRDIDDEFQRINASGTIRVRVDNSALRRADALLAAWRRDQQRNAVRVPVRPDVEPNRFRRFLIRSLTSPIRQAGAFLGGTLSDGIGQGIVGAFKQAGPVGMAILASIIAASLGVIGAAMAGLLVLAFGGAFVALGAVFAAQSEVIQRNWKKATQNMGEDLKRAAEPLVPVIHEAIHQLEGMVDAFAPKLRQFLAEAAPEIQDFLGSMEKGFRKFGEKAWDSLTESFRIFLDAFAPEWEGFMEDLGSSFGALGRTVSRHSTEIAMGLRAVLQILVILIDIVNFFANAWVLAVRATMFQLGVLMKGIAMMSSAFLEAVDFMLMVIEPLAKVMGLGDAVSKARENIASWGQGAVDEMHRVADEALNYGKRLDEANKERQLKVEIEGFKARLELARADLKKTSDQKARAKIQANIDDLTAKLRRAEAKLNAFNGKTAIARIITYSETYRSVHDIVGKATGGVVGKAAHGGVRNNLTLVGEQGPELVDLPSGSRVRSNADSRRLAGAVGDGGGEPMQIVLQIGERQIGEILIDPLRKTISSRGGNVQAVLGKGRS